jgi:DNA-binding transcriptional LysR family regulator
MDIHHIRYFLAVCETRNFTRAAETCNVTQPALSRAIQSLEEEVGGLLFRRERNMTELTELGILMQPRMRDVLQGVTDVRREAKRFMTLEKADMVLGVMCTLGPTRFTAMLSAFRGTYPGISLSLVEGDPRSLLRRLEEGQIDAAILAQPDAFQERIAAIPLYPERFTVAMPAGHRLTRHDRVPMAALDGEKYLERLNCEYREHIEDHMRGSGCRVTSVYESERDDWIQSMVAEGFGVSILPEFSAVVPGIVTRPLADPDISRSISLVTIAGRRYSPALATFVKAVKSFNWNLRVIEPGRDAA